MYDPTVWMERTTSVHAHNQVMLLVGCIYVYILDTCQFSATDVTWHTCTVGLAVDVLLSVCPGSSQSYVYSSHCAKPYKPMSARTYWDTDLAEAVLAEAVLLQAAIQMFAPVCTDSRMSYQVFTILIIHT